MTKITKSKTKKIESEVVNEVVKTKKEILCCSPKAIKIKMIAALLLLAIFGGLYFKFGIVANVNGKNISRISYIQKLQKADGRSLLDQMIQEAIIDSEAKKNKIVVEDKEVSDEIAKIEEQIKAQGMSLEDAMKAEGVTKEEVKAQIKKQKIVEKLAKPNLEVSENEIKDFLEKNKSFLPTGKTKDELNELAKQQMILQKKNEAVQSWLETVQSAAKIIYR